VAGADHRAAGGPGILRVEAEAITR
jgi:hypothetical protein